jgi:hypothetical protein
MQTNNLKTNIMKKTTLIASAICVFSAVGIFNVQAQVVRQYADTTGLSADIKAGAADIYELTSPGSSYTFDVASSNNLTFIKSAIVRAESSLTSKPIIKLNTTGTGSITNIFYTITPDLTISFEGIEFDGKNEKIGATIQPVLFYATSAATTCKVTVKNCFIHDFKNAAPNGVIRLSGSFSSLDMQGSTINNCSGRMLYFNAPATTVGTPNYGPLNLTNCTFSNISGLTQIIYYASTSGAFSTGTTATINHCTFYNYSTTATTSDSVIFRFRAMSGAITIKNSIFDNVAKTFKFANPITTAPVYTIDSCFLAGFTYPPVTTSTATVTNSFVATPTPTYTNAATFDFSLTNNTSFMCGDGYPAGNYYNYIKTGLNNTYSNAKITIRDNEITCSEVGNIELYNLQGVVLKHTKNTDKLIANNLKSGLYLVKFTNINGQVATSKLLLQKQI